MKRGTPIEDRDLTHLRAQGKDDAAKRKEKEDEREQKDQNINHSPDRCPIGLQQLRKNDERQQEATFDDEKNQPLIDVKAKKVRRDSFAFKKQRDQH